MEILSSLSPSDYCVKKILAVAAFNSISLNIKQVSDKYLLEVKPIGDAKSIVLQSENGDVVTGTILIFSQTIHTYIFLFGDIF